MPRYHFHLVDDDVKLDLRIADLAGERAILGFAEQIATGLLNGANRTYAANPDVWEIRVTDDKGAEVFALPLSEVAGKR